MLHANILDAIGNTPVVKINQLANTLDCDIYAKCEFLNPGGSVKDRIGYQMVLKAQKEGKIKPGYTLIEPTSGNTGIGIALAGAVLGYHVIIVMPYKMSHEKQVVLESLGAEIFRTKTAAAWDDPDSHISVAHRMVDKLDNAFVLDQYNNTANPDTHYNYTAQEIIDDFPQLDVLVAGVGTGGTITGLAKRLKAHYPNLKVVGVDPYGSILGGGTEVKPYLVEGIGYDFIPNVLDNDLIDEYIKINDKDSFVTARKLIRHEGLLVGGSSGGAMWAAIKACKDLQAGQKCLVILSDSIRNYMTKFIDDEWMKEQGFGV